MESKNIVLGGREMLSSLLPPQRFEGNKVSKHFPNGRTKGCILKPLKSDLLMNSVSVGSRL